MKRDKVVKKRQKVASKEVENISQKRKCCFVVFKEGEGALYVSRIVD